MWMVSNTLEVSKVEDSGNKPVDIPRPICPPEGSEKLARHGFGLTDEDIERARAKREQQKKKESETDERP